MQKAQAFLCESKLSFSMEESMARNARALLSVSDKAGLIEFARGLSDLGLELVSTGGTAKALSDAELPVIGVSDVTRFPEMLDGRVKTLHPAIHGGILADRSKPEHMQTIAEHGITPIDLVVVNLYPFRETVSKPGVTRADAIENIDIGGPSMVRSAAKNHASVAVVVTPEDYPLVLAEMKRGGGRLSQETRDRLAATAFQHTADYDAAIAQYLSASPSDSDVSPFPKTLSLHLEKIQDLRYGENPHQKAAFYRDVQSDVAGIAGALKLHGKELSFNNIYDLSAAYNLIAEFRDEQEAAVAIIKHTNPCGVAIAPTLTEAFRRARAGDPISAYGGILASSRPIDAVTAELITGKNTFFEAIIAPGYDEDAQTILTEKKQWGANLILLQAPLPESTASGWDYKKVSGGMLIQTADSVPSTDLKLTTATKREPSAVEIDNLRFAWKVVKHVKSNAIVLVKDRQLIGVGAGQMNRVQSVRLAVEQAGDKAQGSVLASDAFFPFSDGPEAAGKAGVTAIIQPGGSKKDEEVVDMANTHNMAMVLTSYRHFRH
jgi:phosphoribosylaminoimidazolecarboxamide formyltransferase/IMP cyclohydrolase